MGPQHGHQQSVSLVLPLGGEVDGALEPLLCVGQEGEQHAGDAGADAAVQHGTGGGLEVVIHVVKAGDAPADHLRDSEHRAPVDVIFLELHLEGPDALLEPGHERHIVRVPAQERHGAVGVRVYHAGHRHHAVGVNLSRFGGFSGPL